MSALPEIAMRELFALDVSAASGLVVRDGVAFVVADDGLMLCRTRLDGTRLAPIPLVPGAGETPLAKSAKPDLEALAGLGDGRLVAFGSGSTPKRETAWLIDPAAGSSAAIDLRDLYAALRERFGALNIEGAVRHGSRLLLAHRGAGRGSASGLAVVDAAACLDGTAIAFPAGALRATHRLDLPDLDGVPLTITDLALHPETGVHFLATAEATANAIDDGPCAGSVIGRLDDTLQPHLIARLKPDVKIEGLAWWHREAGVDSWLAVVDPDDPKRRSPLYALDTAAP